jgi:hypothetical protein
MKKTIITLAIIFGLGLGAYAQGGLFGYGAVSDEEYYGAGNRDGSVPLLSLPNTHGETTDAPAPLGSGIAVLMGLGAAYLVGKKRKEE